MNTADIQAAVRQAIEEYDAHPETHTEAARQADTIKGRQRREQMEHQLNSLLQEDARRRTAGGAA